MIERLAKYKKQMLVALAVIDILLILLFPSSAGIILLLSVLAYCMILTFDVVAEFPYYSHHRYRNYRKARKNKQ
jgi:hypothetical protein